jgi:hypothetical protein
MGEERRARHVFLWVLGKNQVCRCCGDGDEYENELACCAVHGTMVATQATQAGSR